MKVKALKFMKNHGLHGISRKWKFFHGRRPISRKMSRPWKRKLGWSLSRILLTAGCFLFTQQLLFDADYVVVDCIFCDQLMDILKCMLLLLHHHHHHVSWSWTVKAKYKASPDVTILCHFHSISYTQTSSLSDVVQPSLWLSSSASYSFHRAK